MSEYVALSGCPISEELIVNQLSGNDSFLISQPTTDNLKTNFYQSRRISYDTIRDDIYNTVFGDIGLGSMSRESSSDYAPITHDHYGRYSVVSVEQFYKRNWDVDEFDDDVIVLGHIVVDGTSYDVCTPKLKYVAPRPPKIGELKFVASPVMEQIDEYSHDFDGWTYPDGKSLPKIMFPEAYGVFGGTYGEHGDMFNIPVISDFIELNAFRQQENAMERKPYNIALKQHSHFVTQMKISGDFELQGALKNYGISNPNKYTSYHHGSSLPHANTINCDVTFNISDIKILSGNSEENQGVDRENHPSYVNVPVLMYIGGVRNG